MTTARLWAGSDIRRGWRSLLGVALVAALAGGAVLAFLAGARRAHDGVDRFAAATGWPDVMVWSATDVPPSIFTALAADPSVADHAEAQVMTAVPKGLRPGVDGSALLVPEESRYRPQLIEGQLPRAGHPEEVTLSQRDAE